MFRWRPIAGGSYLLLGGTGDSLSNGKLWLPVLTGVLLLTPPGLSLGGPLSGVWRVSGTLGLDVLLFPVSPFHCWPSCAIMSSPRWSMPTFISSNFWMDLDKDKLCRSTRLAFHSSLTSNPVGMTSSPAEEGFCEVVLGSILGLHSPLQQHLLVKLLLLLLLFQMLLHAEPLSVILLDVLSGVTTLDTDKDTSHQNESPPPKKNPNS